MKLTETSGMDKIVCGRSELPLRVAEELQKIFALHRNDPVLFLFSGGSALSPLEAVVWDKLPKNISVAPFDERLSPDLFHRNVTGFLKTKFAVAMQKNNVFLFNPLQEAPDNPAEVYDTYLKTWKKSNPRGVIIALLGVGGDCHIGGVFPTSNKGVFNRLFLDKDTRVVRYRAPAAPVWPLRLTVTLSFLKDEIGEALVYVSGEAKREALSRILSANEEVFRAPAVILNSVSRALLYTDITG